jgi:hypothetical protein
MKNEIYSLMMQINAKLDEVRNSELLDTAEKEEAILFLDKAKMGLREAKYYIGLAEPNLGYELTRILD